MLTSKSLGATLVSLLLLVPFFFFCCLTLSFFEEDAEYEDEARTLVDGEDVLCSLLA